MSLPRPRRTPSPQAGPRGFSLVEVLVTFAITGLLVMTAVPSVGTWMRNAQIRNAAESIVGGLNRARTEAVKRNGAVRFSLVSTNSAGVLDSTCALSSTAVSWVVSVENPAGKCDIAASETTAPRTLEKWARNDGAGKATVTMYAADCTTAATTTSVIYDGYGRIDPNASAATPPIRCLVVSHSNSSSENRALRIVVGASTVRMCDPAISSTSDPRKC